MTDYQDMYGAGADRPIGGLDQGEHGPQTMYDAHHTDPIEIYDPNAAGYSESPAPAPQGGPIERAKARPVLLGIVAVALLIFGSRGLA